MTNEKAVTMPIRNLFRTKQPFGAEMSRIRRRDELSSEIGVFGPSDRVTFSGIVLVQTELAQSLDHIGG